MSVHPIGNSLYLQTVLVNTPKTHKEGINTWITLFSLFFDHNLMFKKTWSNLASNIGHWTNPKNNWGWQADAGQTKRNKELT